MKRLITYEIKNSIGNIFAVIFGIIFPIFMTMLFFLIYKSKIPADATGSFFTQLFITNMLMSPLALVFIGFSALYSQEIEKDVITRMTLFGHSESQQMRAKFVAQFVVLTLSITLYCLVIVPVLGVEAPSLYGLIVLVASILALTISFFLIAYGISLLARKFSITYGITMSLYFAIMVLSGMMGVQPSDLPPAVQNISNLLPTTHMIQDIPKLWTLNSYNIAPLIQSFIFLGAVAGIVYFIAIRSKKRHLG